MKYVSVPSFSSPSCEYLLLSRADISFFVCLFGVLICKQFRRNSKLKRCAAAYVLFYIELYYIHYYFFLLYLCLFLFSIYFKL